MLDWGSLIVWLYAVWAVSRTPKHKPKVIHRAKYAEPFTVWAQINVEEKSYTLVSNNQN